MSSSVLGKRSRRVIDAQDIATDFPESKRRTRQSAPSIYEDDVDSLSCTQIEKTSVRSVQKSSFLRTARLRHGARSQAKCASQDASLETTLAVQTHAGNEDVDVENIVPAFQTPTTIRYKDCLDSKVPSTPRHRIRLTGFLTPRSSKSSKASPRKQNIFTAARQIFTQSSTGTTKLIGRDAERQQIREFIDTSIRSQRGGCTYVSGPPGTGKSALVQEVFHEFEGEPGLDVSVINCVSLRTATEVYSKMVQDLSPNTTVGKSNLKDHLSSLFQAKSTESMKLVLLDEIDNLLDVDCDILYTIFEWAMHKSSSMILVGIANALDLTDRFLPRLKARGLKPHLLPLLPYTASQISTIISDKLRSLRSEDATTPQDFVPLMHPAAVQLCGKKIASQTGDLRKAFSLVRRILDQLERETLDKAVAQSPVKGPLGELSNMATPPHTATMSRAGSDPLAHFTAQTAPRASIAHAAKMASSIFSTGTLSRLAGLNLQQKAVLCSLVNKEKRKMERNPFITPSKSSNKVPSVKDLFIKYSALCKRDEGLLHPLKDTEFRDVVASLETLGLVHEQRGRNSSLLTPTSTPSRAGYSNDDRQFVSAVSEKELRESLNGAGADLLQRLLDEA